MSKRNSEGDVLFNRIAVARAKQQATLASLLGLSATTESHDETQITETDNADLKGGDGDDEQYGVGASIPKEIEDGSFTRRVPTSNDKLLELLKGKKAAKAHLAAKQDIKTKSQQLKSAKPTPILKDESDEEEGRASAFNLRRQRPKKPVPITKGDDTDEEEGRSSTVTSKKRKTTNSEQSKLDEGAEKANIGLGPQVEGSDGDTTKTPSKPLVQRSKPKSYLDEILAERSNKKKKKKTKQNNIESKVEQ